MTPSDRAASDTPVPTFSDLNFEDAGPVARITLNRPEVTNAPRSALGRLRTAVETCATARDSRSS